VAAVTDARSGPAYNGRVRAVSLLERAGAAVARAFPALAVASLLAGCSPAATRHGLLRIVNIAEPDSLNPVVGNFQIDSDLAQLWGGMLFNWSDRDELVPELATEVPTLANGGISPDGRTIVYHLRPGVRWQDGAPFTADDVIWTWHAVMNPKNNVPSTVGYELIASIQRRDAYTISVHLRRAFAPFIATFFAPSSNPYPVLPKHLLARYADINQVAFNSRPVGTGPFTVERWQRGSKIVFRANPHYWRGRPKLDEVWYTPVPDENTIVTLLQTHEADVEYNAASKNYAQLAHIAGFKTLLTPFTQYAQLALNLRTPALSDVRVRRALWLALDSRALIRDVSHGVDTPGHTDQPSFLWAYNPRAARYDYDPAKARALLDAAGWRIGADGVRVKAGARLALVAAGIAGSADGNAVNVLVQRAWHDVGVEFAPKLYTSSLFFESYGAGGIVQTGKFDVAFFSWLNGTDPDDSVNWMCDQFPPKGQNVYHYCNPALDRQERIALASNDRAVRKRAYDQIQQLLAADVPAIIPYFHRRISVVNADLKNYRPPHAVSSFWNCYEWEL
jgi:peptide/nickel transport system substrate-binding protein